jgi:hypothetical protein
MVVNVKIIVQLVAQIMIVPLKLANAIVYLTLMVKLVQTVYLAIMDPFATRNVPILVKTMHVEELKETVQKDVNQIPCLEFTAKIVLWEIMAYIVRTIALKIV